MNKTTFNHLAPSWSDGESNRLRAVRGMLEPHYAAISSRIDCTTIVDLIPFVLNRETGKDGSPIPLPVQWPSEEILHALPALRVELLGQLSRGWSGATESLTKSVGALHKRIDELFIACIDHDKMKQRGVKDDLGRLPQQQLASDTLLESEAQLRAIMETAVDAIITINEQGIVESINPAGENLFGYNRDQIVGRNVSMIMPSPHRENHGEYLRNYATTGVRKIIGIGREVDGRKKGGAIVPLHVAVSELYFGDRRLFTGIVRDLTESQKAQGQLLQSERLAAIGKMMTGLAHESRNALQRSQACLEELASELEGHQDALDLVARIQKALDHIHLLYEEVRNYAAPVILTREECDIAYLWRDTWLQLELARSEKDIELIEDIRCDDTTCWIDMFALGQVFRNVLENAISACAEPGKIVIRCEQTQMKGKPVFQVSICDDGIGISSEASQRIFDPFYTTKPKGTGLGLAIARRIVEAHQGHIEVGPGEKGAEFVITIPCARDVKYGTPS